MAPNAYWLNFFLKRDINVVCWNYRGYGQSTQSFWEFQSAAKAKTDAERVIATAITKLRLKSKIGVYGRSIGGLVACHLAAKYSDLVDVLIIDRSFSEIQKVAKGMFSGKWIDFIFSFFSANGWNC